MEVNVSESCSVVSDSLQLHRLLQPMEFSRPEHWSGQPFPSPGDKTHPGIKPRSPTLRADSLPVEPPGRPKSTGAGSLSLLQGIFLSQESIQVLLHCRQILYLQAPHMWETWVQLLGWEDPMEKGTATHCSILASRIPYSPKSWT